MDIAIVTGSGGLIGSEAALFFAEKKFQVVGIDNNLRQYFFGKEASTDWNVARLTQQIPDYIHYNRDIRDVGEMGAVFERFSNDIKVIIHTAAQPSHDWAAREPLTDFSVNATGTLNLLEMTRKYCPQAVFIFTSTNKVYGDSPNFLPLVEKETRWELEPAHQFFTDGIDETMSIDQSKHSLFGASKVAADVLVQEYGRYFSIKTACFRGGCLTGPNHSGAQLHGFLAYLMKCCITREPYTVFGYKGKQVRNNIHSSDLVSMFWHFYQNPGIAKVYNAGGGRYSNRSMLEAIEACEEITGNKMTWTYLEDNRSGDHIWWISDISKFMQDYPGWELEHDLNSIYRDLYTGLTQRY